MAEFKIGRLRYTWKGQWAIGTFYNRDAVVQHEGKSYVCLVAHTSTNFDNELVFVTPGGASTPYWVKMLDGTSWKGQYTPGVFYSVGNLVVNGGTVFQCTVSHTASAILNPSNWTIGVTTGNYSGPWSINTAYGIGDQVKYGGIVYQCILGHLSAATTSLGLEADQAKWSVAFSGIEYKGDWTSTTSYKLNDLVKESGSLWIATSSHISSSTFSPTNWSLWVPGQEYRNVWSSTEVYELGDVVKYGGYSYVSNTSSNLNNIPSANASANWTLLALGYDFKGDWTSNIQYKVGDVVRRGGRVFTAIQDNTTQDPSGVTITANYVTAGSSGTTVVLSSNTNIQVGMLIVGTGFSQRQTVTAVDVDGVTITISEPPNGIPPPNGATIKFTGINGTNWKFVTSGVSWKNQWSSPQTYSIGDLVVYQNATYICVANHQSSSVLSPQNDTNFEIWQIYLYHARNNASNTVGDIITFDGVENTPLPIPVPDVNNPLIDQVFSITNSLPSWKKINVVPKVFYVTPNGTDNPAYGTTWDRPWGSIKYACETIETGFDFQEATQLLLRNRSYIQEEVWNYIEYQIAQGTPPFDANPSLDEAKTKRDAGYIIDAIAYDLKRGGNSQTVAATLAYFASEPGEKFITPGTAAAMPYFILSLQELDGILNRVLQNSVSLTSYQTLNNIPLLSQVLQVIDNQLSIEAGSTLAVTNLLNIVITSLDDQDIDALPPVNQGITCTVMVRTGTYFESLPIVVPANTAINGDELRGAVVRPQRAINTIALSTNSDSNRIKLLSYQDLVTGDPVQFSGTVLEMFGGLVSGATYYVIDIDINSGITVGNSPSSSARTLTAGIGKMKVYGGDALKDMFRVRDGTGIRNMTLSGLLGSLTELNQYETRRPTGGTFVALDPGTGPDDSSAWIIRRSPYIQNVTTFGKGAVGNKIDGTLHNGGNHSMVSNDFTQIISDGIGVWCTGPGSLTELVSVFSYYNYAGYMAENGGRIRATNGNTSYGQYGVIAEGFDSTETPIQGIVFNQSSQVQANVQSSFGQNSQIVSLNYANAGSGYNTTTTNLLLNSNQLNAGSNWTLSSTSLQQNVTAPNNYAEGWTLSGLSSAPNSDYISQQISIQPAGVVYTAVPATNINGSGVSATFDITVTSTGYTVVVNSGGNGYVSGNQLLISGGVLGGLNNVNDCILTIVSLSGSSILSVTNTGVAPANSNLSYTLSIYAKQGTATSFDLQGVFAGTTTVTSGINYNFSTDTLTPYGLSSGFVPTQYGRIPLDNGWFRVWVAINDITAQNNSLQFKLFPRGTIGTISNNYFYGTQIELSTSTFTPSFYLETTDILYTSYANYKVVGAGSGALLIGNEIRSGAIFQTRVTDPGTGPGGSGYLTASNASQLGDPTYIQLAGSNTNTASELIGMRVFINSGTGAGQYGYISAFNETTKVASIINESFDALEIISSSSADNSFTIGSSNNTSELYITQPVQFLPKSYTNSIQSTAVDGIVVTATLGGIINTFTVASTNRLRRNMEVTFTGNVYGGVTQNFIYYISEILSATTFQVSTSFGGTTWQLLTGTPSNLGPMNISFPTNDGFINGSTTNMIVNMPIQFTGTSTGGIVVGTTYYVNDIIDATTFSISTSLNEITVTATTSGANTLTIGDTSVLTLFNPVVFKSGIVGGLAKDTKYYISNITSSVNFQIVSSVITTTARLTEVGSNLITVDSTVGFIANNPIKFIGTPFGEIISERVYYILAINDATTFTISATPGGSSINLTGQVGELTVKTTPAALALSVSTGATMIGATTSSKRLVTSGYGQMIGTYTTSIYGNIVSGTTYYIRSINSSSNSITLSASSGGPIFNLVSETSAMIMGEVGWDHVNPGTPIAPVLDSSSVYFVEPKTTFARPGFTQTTSTSAIVLAPGTVWKTITYGANSWMALPDGGLTAAFSTNGSTWSSRVLPDNRVWTDLAYGRGYWVAISSGGTLNSKVIYSKSNGIGWRTSNLPSATTWSNISYGNGKFVAIAAGTATSAYSVDNGATWISGSSLPNAAWTSLCYGNGVFVAVASGGTQSAYSTDGINWISGTLPNVAAWSSITYGNGRFIAISSTSAFPAYSFDGITWYSSPLLAFGSVIRYGQGVFLVLRQGNSTAYTTEDGIHWKQRTVASAAYSAVAFGFSANNYVGQFVTLTGQSSASLISAGCTAKGRPVITSGTITSIIMFEPGSNYATSPTVTFIDPNVTTLATVDARIGNGSLANPTFRNRGINYNTTSTAVTILGNGYADAFQTGLTIILKNLTRLPQPGDNLSIDGVNVSYKVTSAVAKFGTLPPSIEANVQIAPDLKVLDSPPNGTGVTIRQKYSQVRLTGHDFLNVGYGNQIDANYPGLPVDTLLAPQDQAVEVNFGRVFYTSTDQDGNFKVGSLFAVEQSTGIITISASQFGLSGLETLSLGGISVGGQSVIIRQFSTDSTFVANSNEILSTQKAIKAYLTGRLSQGGSNTFTGQLTAGTVVIGGSDKISSTIPEGTLGSNVKMLNKVMVDGAQAAWAGDGAAMAYFMKTWHRR